MIAFNRLGKPEDIADVIAFVAKMSLDYRTHLSSRRRLRVAISLIQTHPRSAMPPHKTVQAFFDAYTAQHSSNAGALCSNCDVSLCSFGGKRFRVPFEAAAQQLYVLPDLKSEQVA